MREMIRVVTFDSSNIACMRNLIKIKIIKVETREKWYAINYISLGFVDGGGLAPTTRIQLPYAEVDFI